MYSKNDRANKAMTDAVAAGVTCFAPGPNSPAKIIVRPGDVLMLGTNGLYGEREQAVLAQIAAWTGTSPDYIAIKQWLNKNY